MTKSLDLARTQDAYILAFYEALDCPRSLCCALLFKYKEYKVLVALGFKPEDYNSEGQARDSLAATKFLSKNTFLDTGNDKEAVAIEKFFAGEAQCRQTNQRIRRSEFKNSQTQSVLLGMNWKIQSILGEFDSESFIEACDWGPGATTLLPKRMATKPKKYSVERKITATAYDFVKSWFLTAFPHWDIMFEIDGYTKIITVPKDAETDRTIGIEPGINLFFQKGLGTLVRQRLKRVGVDLNHQRRNQQLAKIGSINGRIATVDFRNASNCISINLVREALGERWLTLFTAFRSSHGLVGKEVVEFEMFSSMGNGYTFELESLLFYAMAASCCDQVGVSTKDLSVFGDDVILPAEAFDLFQSVSADLGFSFNDTKSFNSGYYRESCGQHYWGGKCIKPIFQKEPLSGTETLLKSANNLRRFAHRRINSGCDRAFRRCWQIFADCLGVTTPRISEGYGDLGLVVNYDETDPSVTLRAPHGWEGYYVRLWAPQIATIECSDSGMYLYKMRSAGLSRVLRPGLEKFKAQFSDGVGGGNHLPLPGKIKMSKIRVLIPYWVDLGEWV